MSSESKYYKQLLKKLEAFIRKDYLQLLIFGVQAFIAAVLINFTFYSFLELIANFSSLIRTVLFLLFIVAVLLLLFFFLVKPVIKYIGTIKKDTYFDAAVKVGTNFPDLKDELLNSMQLVSGNEKDSIYSSKLIDAAFRNVYKRVESLDFNSLVNFKSVKKILPYFAAVTIFCLLLILFVPGLNAASSRLINFDKEFIPPQKFIFIVSPGNSEITKGDDLEISVKVERSVPVELFLLIRMEEEAQYQRQKLTADSTGFYKMPMKNIRSSFTYFAEAEGVNSEFYQISVIDPPVLETFELNIKPPAYSKIPSIIQKDNGNISSLVGTKAEFKISSSNNLKKAYLEFGDSTTISLNVDGQISTGTLRVTKDDQYRIWLQDQNGNFKRARVIPKNEARTIIPCTEASGGRSGIKPESHPLCDKLQYIARDFFDFGGVATSGYSENPKEPYEQYQDILRKWCESEHSHPKAKAVLKYIEQGNIIKDLVECQVLFIGTDQKLLKMWNDNDQENVPDIFKLLPGKKNKKNGQIENWQADAFVRWIVEIPDNPQSAVWTDSSMFQSWINYYSSKKENRNLCYVTGTESFGADQHPAKLRNDGDKAKLISSNDTSGFTFRGRFLTAEQACSVGFEVTQKAHGALRWLISRQGYRRGEQAIVAWSTRGDNIPDPLADPLSILGFDEMKSDSESSISTAQELALRLKKKIAGYSAYLGDTTGIVVIGLEAATPGRMSITFYRELTGSEFLDRIENWHNTCCWIHDYRYKEVDDGNTRKKRKVRVRFVGAPAPSDIAEAAYGRRFDDKLRKATVERILPCIIDGQKIPKIGRASCRERV